MADTFHVVEAIPCAADDWAIVGIYSKREDADAHVARLHGDPSYIVGSVSVEEGVTMLNILERLGRERLGALAAQLARLGVGRAE